MSVEVIILYLTVYVSNAPFRARTVRLGRVWDVLLPKGSVYHGWNVRMDSFWSLALGLVQFVVMVVLLVSIGLISVCWLICLGI